MRRLLLVLCMTLCAPALAAPSDDALVEVVRAREAEVLAHLQVADPVRYRTLVALKQEDPRAYLRALLITAAGEDRPPPNDAVRAELARVDALRQRYPGGLSALPASEQQAVRAELREVAGRIFALKQADRQRRVAELRQMVERLQAEVAQREVERDALIEAWVERVLAGGAGL